MSEFNRFNQPDLRIPRGADTSGPMTGIVTEPIKAQTSDKVDTEARHLWGVVHVLEDDVFSNRCRWEALKKKQERLEKRIRHQDAMMLVIAMWLAVTCVGTWLGAW